MKNLNTLQGAPSVQMQEVPPDYNVNDDSILRNERDDDVSGAQAEREGIHTNDTSKKQHPAEYYDGAQDQDSNRSMDVEGP